MVAILDEAVVSAAVLTAGGNAAGRWDMNDQVLLRDVVAIPDEVHAGDFVLSLAKGVGEKSTITEYVVTEPLAANFDRALGLIKSAVETNASRAAYLDGSFGSGKSHFMAVLYAILSGELSHSESGRQR
jgi:hypothetical protein